MAGTVCKQRARLPVCGKVAGKLYGPRLFISVNGFSSEVIRSLVMQEIQTLFIDGEDLILVLEGHLSLREMIDRKVKAAQTKGSSTSIHIRCREEALRCRRSLCHPRTCQRSTGIKNEQPRLQL